MNTNTLKIAASVLIIGGGVGYLMYSSMAANLEYYKQVDEIADEMESWIGVRIRLAGNVKEGSIFHRPATHEYLFTVAYGGAEIPVHYKGSVPDSFMENAEVVVAGRLRDDGTFEGDRVFAKCPSKYEAREPLDDGSRPGHPGLRAGSYPVVGTEEAEAAPETGREPSGSETSETDSAN